MLLAPQSSSAPDLTSMRASPDSHPGRSHASRPSWAAFPCALLAAGLLAAACSGETPIDPVPADGGPVDWGADLLRADAPVDVGPGPSAALAAYCTGKVWHQTQTPAVTGKLSGTYTGYLTGLGSASPFEPWTLETVKVIPEHLFRVTKIRVAFAAGKGQARIRLTTTFGRSVPGMYPNIKDETYDLITPVTLTVNSPSPDTWTEINVEKEHLFLEPTQHYMIIYQHLAQEPYLAMESVPSGEYSRSYLFVPTSVETYGLADASGKTYNYRMELLGYHVCALGAAERTFSEDKTQAFATEPISKMAFSDLDGDGRDDLIVVGATTISGVSQAAAKLFVGDGLGGFKASINNPFSAMRSPSMLLFGDIDNDGDRDVFVFPYVSADGDGDKVQVTGTSPDCDDTDAKRYPGATEVAANGKDDDCNGITDDGKDTMDADSDGTTIASGDCDDTRKDVRPGGSELLDGRDNDCDKLVDEDFVNQVWTNDGKGGLTLVKASGIEAVDPSTAAALADANGDGKLDVYWGNWLVHYPDDAAVQDRYFEGQGNGLFQDALKTAGLELKTPYSVYGVRWLDFNNDGFQDLYVSNYHLYPNQLWKNLGNGTFVDVAEAAGVAHDAILPQSSIASKGMTGGHSYGMDFGDTDNDGDMDLYISNLAHPRTRPWADPSIYAVNSGSSGYTFTDKTASAGFLYDEGDVNAAFADYDNDGDLDLAIASLYTGHYSRLYRNDGPLGFRDITYESGTAVHDAVGVIWADADRDGDLDLFLFGRAIESSHVYYFKNQIGAKKGWIELLLQGTTTNRDGIGARITLKAGGAAQIRQARGGGGGCGNVQEPRIVHFGLGASTQIDQLTVHWAGGATETFSGAKPNGRYLLIEGKGTAAPLSP